MAEEDGQPEQQEEPPAEEPPAEESPEDTFEFAAVHDVEDPPDSKWEGLLIFRKDGTFSRKGGWISSGDKGTWEVSEGSSLVLTWEEHDPETVTSKDFGLSFQNDAGFTLKMAEGEPPEWFRASFPKPDPPGRCVWMLTACCPASVTEHEGEPETVIQQMFEQVQDALDKIDDGIDAVQEQVANVVDAARDAAVDMLGLDDKFKGVSDNALDDIAPKAGQLVVTDAADFIPAFETLDKHTKRDLDGEAQELCSNKILSFRERIHDFCEDVVEFLKEGFDMIAGALKCLYKVVSWILRACKEGVSMAVELLKKVIPDCCETACLSCCGLGAKIIAWITQVFNKVVDMVEEFIKDALRAVGVPESICEKIDFNGNASADNASDEDKPMKQQKAEKEGAAAPEQQSMEAGEEPVV